MCYEWLAAAFEGLVILFLKQKGTRHPFYEPVSVCGSMARWQVLNTAVGAQQFFFDSGFGGWVYEGNLLRGTIFSVSCNVFGVVGSLYG